MKILLIGHKGYLGKGLYEFLKVNHNVIGWDKKENIFNLDAKFLAQQNIEMLINLSVMADRQSKTFQIDAPTDEVNVSGARHLAKILKGSDIHWIQMSTREVLGPVYELNDVIKTKKGYRPKFLVNEECAYAPFNFYGKSKIMAEFISESHPKSNIIRLTTCYTDYDHPGGNWVVSLIRAAIKNGVASLTQGGMQFRDPLHINDLGELMVKLHEHKICGERIHAGGGEENFISLEEFVKLANPKVDIKEMPGGDYGFAFDINKAKRLVNWIPCIRIRDKIAIIAKHIHELVTEAA